MAIKAYASNFTIRLGLVSAYGRLVPVRAKGTKESVFKYCTLDGGRPVRQVYIDDEGNVYEKENLGRARVENEQYVQIPMDTIQEASESTLPLNVLDLTVHDRSVIDQHIFPSDNQAYVFDPVRKNSKGKIIPDPKNRECYEVINVILRDSNAALIGKANLQGHEGLFRLGLYQGRVTVQKQLYPEDLNEFDFDTPALTPKQRRLAVDYSQKLTEGFSPEPYANTYKARLLALEAVRGDETKAADKEPQFSLEQALEAALSAS